MHFGSNAALHGELVISTPFAIPGYRRSIHGVSVYRVHLFIRVFDHEWTMLCGKTQLYFEQNFACSLFSLPNILLVTLH